MFDSLIKRYIMIESLQVHLIFMLNLMFYFTIGMLDLDMFFISNS